MSQQVTKSEKLSDYFENFPLDRLKPGLLFRSTGERCAVGVCAEYYELPHIDYLAWDKLAKKLPVPESDWWSASLMFDILYIRDDPVVAKNYFLNWLKDRGL